MVDSIAASEPISADVVVIGAGPVGLFAIFECGMLQMRCHVVDALDAVGGQCTALYPQKPIYDIPAWPRIGAAELIDQLMQQAEPFKPVFHLGQQVDRLHRTEDGAWLIGTSAGRWLKTSAVIIAAGVGAFGPNRPPLEGIERYEGAGVQYLVGDVESFRDQRVVIAGGGDSAIDWALVLSDIARSVAIVHRRDKFRAQPESVARLHALAEAGRLDLVVPYQLAGLEGTGDRLEAVLVSDLDGGQRRLEADRLLPFFGLSMALGPILEWGLAVERNHIAVDPATAATNLPGVFAIGDVAQYPGKLKLILTGFAEAAGAAHAAHPLVHPERVLHFEYSTTKGVPSLG